MTLYFVIPAMDFSAAGKASTEVKKLLSSIGFDSALVKRVAVAMYEGEMNVAIHGGGGQAEVNLDSSQITIRFTDHGPGISDIDLAMTEGYSTASEEVRSMGFGAGMGLPNMKRNADALEISSKVNEGTTVTLVWRLGAVS